MNFLKKLTLLSVINSTLALAGQNSDMVWEEPTRLVSKSISGPVAMAIGVAAIAITGMMWALTDGSAMGKGIKIIIALGLTGGAGIFVNAFGLTSGMTF